MLEPGATFRASEQGVFRRDHESPTKEGLLSSENVFRSMGIFGSMEPMPLCDSDDEEHPLTTEHATRGKLEDMQSPSRDESGCSAHLMGGRIGAGASWMQQNIQEDRQLSVAPQRWPHIGNERPSPVADPGLSAEAGQMVSLLGSLPLISCNDNNHTQLVPQLGTSSSLPHQINSPSGMVHCGDDAGSLARVRGSRGRSTRGRPPWKRRSESSKRDRPETPHYDSYMSVCPSETNLCEQKRIVNLTPITTASTQESTVEIVNELRPVETNSMIVPCGFETTDDCPLSAQRMSIIEGPVYNTLSDASKGMVGMKARRPGPPRPRGRPRKYPPTLPRDYRPVFSEEHIETHQYGVFDREEGDSARRKEKRGRPSGRGTIKGGRMRRTFRGHFESECIGGFNPDAPSDVESSMPEQDKTCMLPSIDTLKAGPSDGLFSKLCVAGERNIKRVLQYNYPELAQSMGKMHWEMLEKEPWLAYQLVADVKPTGQRYHFDMTNDLLRR